MAKYDIKFSCGHLETISLIGPHTERQRRIEYYETYCKCEQCSRIEYEKRIQEANERAKQESEKLELPELEGTEKQVDWANTLRMNLITQYYKLKEKYNKFPDDFENLFIRLINKSEAKFFIENRSSDLKKILIIIQRELESEKENVINEENRKQQEELDFLEKEAEKEMTIFVNETNDVAKIEIFNNTITVFYKYDKLFIEIVKSLGFEWNNKWQLVITGETYGIIEDRAAELGIKLIENNINVLVTDESVRNKILAKDYKERVWTWLIFNKKNQLKILNYKNSNVLYKKFKNKEIVGKWENGGIIVEVDNYRQIIKFCKENNISITTKAYEYLKGYAGEENIKTIDELKEDLCDD